MIIVNYIAAGILKFLSLMPFWFLHLKSDFFFLVTYYVIGYRKKVVFMNLRNSFPKKSSAEIRKIARSFYHNLCDIIFEEIKIGGISEKEARKRMVFKNMDILEDLRNKNKSVIGMIGHSANWEWVGILSGLSMPYPTYALYKPLSNQFFNNYQLKIRTRFGLEMIQSKNAMRHFVQHKNELTFTFMAADQTPIKSEIQYWTNFLNQDTPVFTGAEKIAKSLGCAIVFADIKRIKRGYYEVTITKLSEDPINTQEHEITEQYMRLLEKSIIEQPEKWLWSHRRWKHKRTE